MTGRAARALGLGLGVALVAMLFWGGGICRGRNTGTIIGVITDASTGKPVEGAMVIATGVNLRGEENAFTGRDGSYAIRLLPAGPYKLTVQIAGYKPTDRADIRLSAEETLRVDISVVTEAERSPPPPPPPPHPLGPPKPKGASGPPSQPYYWNYWAEKSGADAMPTFEALDSIPAGGTFRVFLELAPLRCSGAAATGGGPAAEFGPIVERARKTKTKLLFNLLVLPDSGAYDTQPGVTTLEIEPASIERAEQNRAAGFRVKTVSDCYDQRIGVTAPPIELTTKGGTAGKDALVAISVWDSAWSRPIGEFILPLKIGQPIARDIKVAEVLGGLDFLRSHGASGPAPAAAVHFLALSMKHPVRAIMRLQKREQPIIWSLKRGTKQYGPEGLKKKIAQVARELGMLAVADTKSVVAKGDALRKVLFPDEAAAGALEELVSGLAAASAKEPRPSLYVRLLGVGPDAPILVPASFVYLTNSKKFLGEVARLESPLEEHTAGETCTSSWALLRPPPSTKDNAMKLMLQGALDPTLPTSPSPSRESSSARSCVGEEGDGCRTSFLTRWRFGFSASEVPDFAKWLREETEPAAPWVMVLMGHQDGGTFYVDGKAEKPERLSLDDFQRTFAPASVAILAGCETAGVPSAELIRAVNALHVSSIVATSTKARGGTLGTFLRAFAAAVEAAGPQGRTVGDAFDAGLREVSGWESLQFTLLGDPGVRICYPGGARGSKP